MKTWLFHSKTCCRSVVAVVGLHLNELQDAVSRVVSFVLVHRGAVEDDRGRVGLDVVLERAHRRHSGQSSASRMKSEPGRRNAPGMIFSPWSRGRGGRCSRWFQTSSVRPAGWRLFSARAAALDTAGTTAETQPSALELPPDVIA